MVNRPTYSELTKNVENPFELVIMASKRARNLNNGGRDLKENYRSGKVVSKSLEEIAGGKIVLKDGDQNTEQD
ncbi:DNA-directed RNA polymerase subunit omega [Halarsenatibacter silvermanii]|uniref:DNA-directed RNA polymerase subunit omega n=1 Tax=Halarsenatibacter silvermanii TaxID=321763 RepID=A0A1G9JJG0_9FIRM|nr:DNA-directed RNA polymerase subunit omega [Halarsenatibacter silvermanii]SDL37717.1 DNA-directed RNA polymerase subunit omega [Halarsenatibacter silvermanii]